MWTLISHNVFPTTFLSLRRRFFAFLHVLNHAFDKPVSTFSLIDAANDLALVKHLCHICRMCLSTWLLEKLLTAAERSSPQQWLLTICFKSRRQLFWLASQYYHFNSITGPPAGVCCDSIWYRQISFSFILKHAQQVGDDRWGELWYYLYWRPCADVSYAQTIHLVVARR